MGDVAAGTLDGRPETGDGSVLRAFFSSYFARRPVNATFTGVHEHDHRLPDWSAQGTEATLGEMRDLRVQLAAEGIAALSEGDVAQRNWAAVDGALADSFLEIQIAELEGRHFQRGNPSLVIGEAVFAVVSLMTRDFAPLAQRARMARARLREIPGFLASALGVVAEAPVPPLWAERALRECEGGRVLFSSGIDRWRQLEGIPDDLRQALRESADMALGAVEAFAREVGALSADAVPARAIGPETLELLVRRGHWSDRGAEELLRQAREEFARAKGLLKEEAHRIDPGGVAGVQERLAELHPTPAGYYRSFAETWEACRSRSEALGLVTWPEFPIRYVPIPEWTRAAAPFLYYLFYRSPAPFDPVDVHDYVVTPIEGLQGDALRQHLRSWNDSVIKLNHVVHHGALGHHVQNWYAGRAASRIGGVAAVDCASRIGMFLGGTMAEGWACYATDLMDEAGFLTPEERVSEQQSRVRMLARAIVDLEFHSGVRSFDDCVRLYVEEVGMPPQAARAESVKNSMFPGTALMYWLGTSGIHELRQRVRRRRGAEFSPRAFHDELLSFGSIPVALASRLLA